MFGSVCASGAGCWQDRGFQPHRSAAFRRATWANSRAPGALTRAAEPSPVKVIDLQMLVVPGGQERTEADWHTLLGDGGFKLKRIVAGGGSNLIEALPA